MCTRVISMILVLSFLIVSSVFALDPLPIDTRLITYLDPPVDGQHGLTAILGYNLRQTALIAVPNTPTPQTLLVSVLGQMTPLACPGGELTTSGQAINRRGDVGGFCTRDGVIQGFLFRATTTRTPYLFVLPEDALESQVLGLNDAQHLVGAYRDQAGRLHGFLQRGLRFTSVDASGASDTVLTAINNRGRLVGYGYGPDGLPHGVIGTVTSTGVTLEPLNVPDSLLTILLDLNDAEDVVGFTFLTDGTATAFVRLQGTFYSVRLPVPHLILTDLTGIGPQGHLLGRVLIDDGFNPAQVVVSQGFILAPGVPTPTAVQTKRAQAVQAQAMAREEKGQRQALQVTVTGCEDLAAGVVRPAKLGMCR